MDAYEKEQLKKQVMRKVEWERYMDKKIEKDYPSVKIFSGEKSPRINNEPKVFLMDKYD